KETKSTVFSIGFFAAIMLRAWTSPLYNFGMITFACPHCSRALKVKEELAGKKAKCPACGQPVTIPGSVRVGKASAQVESPTLFPEAERDSQEPARKPDPQTQALQASEAESKSDGNTQPASTGDPSEWDFLVPPVEPDEMGRLGSYRILKVLGSG